MIGETVAHYRITGKIGAGGMGEVYQATDTKLNREVALKIIPEIFAADSQRMGRFQREAQVLASLNHPGIAAIYGIEESGTTRALVLELVEGDDLSQRIGAGPIPGEDAIDYARQIAEAVEVAHESGVVHRDLKPGNIKITPAGGVKVLDFGLAKALEGEKSLSGADASMSPTLTAAATQAGVVLGTAAYMSPGQARGKPVDRRADIWSFGVVFFEMLSGGRVFSGETVSDTLAAVIKDEPDWTTLPGNTHPALQALLRRCLEKDPRRRLQSIGEARIILEGIQAGDTTLPLYSNAASGAPGGEASRKFSAATGGWLALAALLVAAASLTGWRAWVDSSPGSSPHRITFGFRPADLRLGQNRHPVISPDGQNIVYIADGEIWIRDLTTREPRRVESAAGVGHLAWSPGGKTLAFAIGASLMQVPAASGTPVQVSTLPVSALDGLAWTDDGWIYFAGGVGPMYRVPDRGGEAVEVLPAGGEDLFDYHPPGPVPGGSIVYAVHRKSGADTIEAFDGAERKVIIRIEGGSLDMPRYVEGGHLVFHRSDGNDGVWAVPFDAVKLAATGEPFLVAVGGRYPSVSRDGTLVYVDPGDFQARQLVEIDRQGEILRLIGEPRPGLGAPAVHPDGSRAMVTLEGEEGSQVWTVNLGSGEYSRLTLSDEPHLSGAWLPGGDRVAVHAGSGGMDSRITLLNINGRGEPEVVGEGIYPAFTPDGKTMVYTALNPGTAADIMVAGTAGEEAARPFLQTPSMEGMASLSPDGKLLAYIQGEGSLPEIYLTTFPGGEATWQISRNKGFYPVWSLAGDEIFYVDPRPGQEGGTLMAVTVQSSPDVRAGRATDLFDFSEAGLFQSMSWPMAAPMPGGQSFIAILEGEAAPDDQPAVVVVQNGLVGRDEGGK